MRRLKKGDILIVCGDFGFLWNSSRREKRVLKKLSRKPYTVAFLDGAHENFDLLKEYEVNSWMGGKVHKISENVYHLMRGQIFQLDGLRVFVFGGGESPDKDMRIEHVTWWKEELPSREEILEAAHNLQAADFQVDVILTYEPPSRIKEFMHLKTKEFTKTNGLNIMLEEICNSCQYRRWYFGSLHHDKVLTSVHTAVFRQILSLLPGGQEQVSSKRPAGN